MDTLKRHLKSPCQSICKRRFTDTRDILDQQMPFSEHGDQCKFDRLRLALDDALDGSLQPGDLTRNISPQDNILTCVFSFCAYPISH